jgi:predicted nucleic-acid-binding protein
MIAVDTNLIVRMLTQDDPDQFVRATELIASASGVFIAKTVVLETAWVLRSSYGFDSQAVATALLGLAGVPNIVFEDAQAIKNALQFVQNNQLDFADALHLATAQAAGAEPFYTFDRPLIRRTAGLSMPAVEPESCA